MRRENQQLKKLGEAIRRRRLKKDLTQDRFESAGLSYKHFQDIERGVINISYLTLVAIAKTLGCAVRDLAPPHGGRVAKKKV